MTCIGYAQREWRDGIGRLQVAVERIGTLIEIAPVQLEGTQQAKTIGMAAETIGRRQFEPQRPELRRQIKVAGDIAIDRLRIERRYAG